MMKPVLLLITWIYLPTASWTITKYTNAQSERTYNPTHRESQTTGCNFTTWPKTQLVAKEPGDIMLGAIIRVHENSDEFTCGEIVTQAGIQVVEALLFTIDRINADKNFFPGFRLGVEIKDDCNNDNYGVDRAVEFVKGGTSSISGGCHGNDSRDSVPISGVIGATSSRTSMQVASLLKLFKLPQVSHYATIPELSNKERYPYFLRTIPSDTTQAGAIVQLIRLLKWTYVSAVYENSFYGLQGVTEITRQLDAEGICTARKEKLQENSGDDVKYNEVVSNLLSAPSARGVIVFASPREVRKLMEAVKELNATGHFVWIGNDGWGGQAMASSHYEPEMEGAIAIQPFAFPLWGFNRYFNGLRPSTNKRNPWFSEFWEVENKCRDRLQPATPFNCQYKKDCTGAEELCWKNADQEAQIQHVSDAVMAFSHAIKAMHAKLCNGTRTVCAAMKPLNTTLLKDFLHEVKFTGLAQAGKYTSEFQFQENGDGPARYHIANFRKISPGKYKWENVGTFENDRKLKVNRSNITYTSQAPDIPDSMCSKPCARGQAKQNLGNSCCWKCRNCTEYERVSELGDACISCPNGTLPVYDGNKCVEIPFEYLQYTNGVVIGSLIYAILGVLTTVFVIFVFIKYRETAIVRASGRELSFVLLAGILLCYIMTFVLTAKPTDVSCGFQKAGIGLCYTVCYAALLTKTNRIARIFQQGMRSVRRPKFISPLSQLIICGSLILVELIIIALWLMQMPPKAGPFYPTRREHHLVCMSLKGMEYMIGFAYPMLLIIICTIYAILTRKIPEGFNESKYIGFAMYTTCIIWLAFIPIYVTTAKNIQLRVITMCFSVSLSATVSLICLFAPKLYIILLRPERNVKAALLTKSNSSFNRKYTSPAQSTVAKFEQSSMVDTEIVGAEELELKEKQSSSLNSDSAVVMTHVATQTNSPDCRSSLDASAQTEDVVTRLRNKYPHLSNRYYNK